MAIGTRPSNPYLAPFMGQQAPTPPAAQDPFMGQQPQLGHVGGPTHAAARAMGMRGGGLLDAVMLGMAPPVHQGAFGGRTVHMGNAGYRTHPMAVSTPGAAPAARAGDPGMWFNQAPQGFDAAQFVANNPTFGTSVPSMNGDGSVRLTGVQSSGGGTYMDPVRAARAYIGMGGKGITLGKDAKGNPAAFDDSGNVVGAQDMFDRNLQLRRGNRDAKAGDIARSARVRNATNDAMQGRMGPMMSAIAAGLVKDPGAAGAPEVPKAGNDMMIGLLKDMLPKLPPDKLAAIAPVVAAAIDSGNPAMIADAMKQIGATQTSTDRAAKSRWTSAVDPVEQDFEVIDTADNPDVAYNKLVAAGREPTIARRAVMQRHPEWKPKEARSRWMSSVDPDTGDITSLGDYLGYINPVTLGMTAADLIKGSKGGR